MDEKFYLENVLTMAKSLIMLYINGEIESTNIEVKKLMHDNLDKSLDMQYKLFKCMEKNGLYNLKNLDKTTINKTYTKLKTAS